MNCMNLNLLRVQIIHFLFLFTFKITFIITYLFKKNNLNKYTIILLFINKFLNF